MSLDADLLADRRRLRRKLSLWRVVAFAALIALVVAGGWALGGRTITAAQSQIARVRISGFIAGDRRTLDLLKSLRDAQGAKAVLVTIDSPGGTTTGAEALYDALRRLSEKKPTVAVVDGMAASGGYIAALGTDRIVARETALVGSIGVLFQYPNVARLLETIGVTVEAVKSSPLKAAPSGFEPTSPEARAALESIVKDTYEWFKRLVRERRSYDDTGLASVSDGRIFTGRQALGLRLVDEIGGEREAIAWLEREKGIAKDLPVREWKPRSDRSGIGLWSSLAAGAAVLGYPDLAAALDRAAAASDLGRLDGLLAVWHPSLEKALNYQ
ncbi:signal peptide peptidase SppA [Chelatococcus sp. SYSU_G07232]|uniref:Signal peptide peptidase SppA n=1 Tax=Chelatococcus albus TaxID=3047466 RepID=A0ABT7AHM7_9HYPH|nr:signal peptide peptidase SppA [Chelatococcus sp. SYSU_G07232]MDJ1158882.1 signal peptide peptidase SppA [Chelatococcus sp. SYSU_G07232]